MAILISKSFDLVKGVSTDQVYMRLGYSVEPTGKTIKIEVANYASRDAYDSGNKNSFKIIPIQNTHFIEYDREKDGTDILQFIHEKIRDYLVYEAEYEIGTYDPLTGTGATDPSTGEVIMTTVIKNPIVTLEEISFIDIDVSTL